MAQTVKTAKTFIVHIDGTLNTQISSFKTKFLAPLVFAKPIETINQIKMKEEDLQTKLEEKLREFHAVFIVTSENFAKFFNDEMNKGKTHEGILPSPLYENSEVTYDTFKTFFDSEVQKEKPKLFLVYTLDDNGDKLDAHIPKCLDGLKAKGNVIEVSLKKKDKTTKKLIGYDKVCGHVRAFLP
uniref:Uncharacterized protein n=1 Tax=Clytia hemisphaerica TaxID=252671 RepID=A0A7M5V827_9CNID